PDAGSSPRESGSLPGSRLRNPVARSKPLQGLSFGKHSSAPDAGSSPRESGSLPALVFGILSLRSKPLQGFAFGKHSSAPDAGSSHPNARKPRASRTWARRRDPLFEGRVELMIPRRARLLRDMAQSPKVIATFR